MHARVLTTPRLRLVPLDAGDAAAMFAGMADPAMFMHVDGRPPADVGVLERRYARVTAPGAGSPDRWLNWTIRRAVDGAYAGLVEVTLRADGIAWLAYFTFTRFGRQGLAREACAAVIASLRADFNVREVVATMDVRNVASWRLVESLGFTRDAGTEASSIRGEPTQDYRYRLSLR